MKKIVLGVLALTITIVSFAQKPKKTYDENKFMKKVQFAFTPELINKYMPDAVALQYVSEKSGKSLKDLEAANAANLESIKNSITAINALGLVYVWDNVEVKIIQESPVKVANLLIHCHAKEKKFVINLTNCVQTNLSWYLGDGVVPEGDGFEAVVTATEIKNNKKPGGMLGKMNDLNKGVEDMETNAQIQLAILQMKKDSLNARRPGYESKLESYVYDKSKINLPMRGYYILKDGTVVDAVILNQAPEFLVGDAAHGFDLVICGGPGTTPMNGFDTKHPNFEKYINKKDIKAFYVNGYLYKNVGFYGWAIALDEGAIHSYITVVKVTVDKKQSYQIFKQTQKLDSQSYGSILMPISNENLIKMMADAPEIVKAYKDGQYDLQSAEIEYNIWYDTNNPNKIDYVLGVNGKR